MAAPDPSSRRVTANTPLPPAAAAAARAGRTVEAIRLVREAEGGDLAAAKARVDAWVASDPALAKRIEERRKEVRRQIVGWAIAIDVVIVAALAAWWFAR